MKKQRFNIHTHTARCGHAEGLDIQYVNAAIDAGFKTLGFSEHVPYVEMRLPNCRMFYEQKNEYLASIRSLQAEFKERIDIKVGYEVEYLEDHFEYLLNLKKECDYMILGQHCKFIDYEYDCYCSDADVLTYTKQIEDALSKNFITYVAHPDYFMLGRRTFSSVCEEASHRIAKASIKYDIPLEINLNGFRYGKKNYAILDQGSEDRYPYPFKEFWQIIASYHCKVLFGYDAHSPITLLDTDREALALQVLDGIKLNFVESIQYK